MPHITLIASAFFPYPGVAAVRVTNWAKMLAANGFRVTVVARYQGYTASSDKLFTQLGEDVDVRILGADGEEVPPLDRQPQRQARLSWKDEAKRQVNEFWIPDGEIRFWRRAYPRIQSIVGESECQLVITTSPQHSVAEVGRWLQKDLTLPWVADFRDPVLLDERTRPRGLARGTMRHRRRWLDRVYNSADAVVHAIPLQARWARLVYPDRRHRFSTLRHPVPADLVEGNVAPIPSVVPGRRVISVVGFQGVEVLTNLAAALARLVRDNPAKYDLELRLVGAPPNDDQQLRQILGERLVLVGRVPNQVAKQHMVGSSVLVSALSSERQRYLGVSSKLFEYAGARRPIITIRPTRCDRELLRHLPSHTLEQPDEDKLVDLLVTALQRDPADVDRELAPFIEKFSWQSHCQRLTGILRSVLQDGVPFDLRD